MSFYTQLAANALALIQSKGRQLTIRKYTGRTFNAVTGTYSGGATVTGTIDCVVLSYSKNNIGSFDERLFQDLATTSLRFLLIAASSASFVLEPTHEVDLDGVTYTVLGNTPLNPAGTPLIYRVAIHKK